MDKNKLISIIIPCYNSEKFIRRTLDHLISQTYTNLEIICINDGSLDDTTEILAEYSKKYNFIKVFEKENDGIESAIRVGIKNSTGDFIYLHGHDDYLSKDAFEKAIGGFIAEDINAVRMDLFFVNEQGKMLRKMQDRRILNGKQALIETVGWKVHTFCLWKAAVFKKIIEIDTQGMMDFDELGTRYLYSISKRINFCEGIYYYVQHSDSVSKKINYRFFDRIYTHTLFRQLLISNKVYEQVKEILEKELYDELVSLIKIYNLNKDRFDKNQRTRIYKIIKKGYKTLNRKVLLNNNKVFKNRHKLVQILGGYSLKNFELFNLLIKKNIIR